MTLPREHVHPAMLCALGTAFLLAALAAAYTGVIGGVPQDEGGYVFAAQDLRDSGTSAYIKRFCAIDTNAAVNPATLIQTRFVANWFLARPLSMANPSLNSFGWGGVSFVVAAYLLCLALVGGTSGTRIAVSCCTVAFFNPALLVSASRALPDSMMAAGLMVSFAALFPAGEKSAIRVSRAVIAGVSFGGAVLIKEGALVTIAPLLATLLLFPAAKRVRAVVIVGAVAGLVIAVGYSAVWVASGCRLWIPSVIRAAHAFKFFEELRGSTSVHSFAFVDLMILPGYSWLYHLRHLTFIRGISLASLHYASVLPVIVVTALTLAVARVPPSGLRVFVPAVLLWAALDFGPTDLFIQAGRLTYCPIFKELDSFKFSLYFAPVLLLPLHTWASFADDRRPVILLAGVVVAVLSASAAGAIASELRTPVEAIKSHRFAVKTWLDAEPRRIIVSDTYSSFVLDLSLERRERNRIVSVGNFIRRPELINGGEVLYLDNRWLPIDIDPNYEERERQEFLRQIGSHLQFKGPDFAIYSTAVK